MLDWGLGHTTRSIPIIKHLIESGFHIVVACNSVQKALLKEELASVEFVFLEGYELIYSKAGWKTRLKIFLQIPKILIKVKQENRWLQQFIQRKRIDLIVSDNRFGIYSLKITSVFITHQLAIKTGMGAFADKLIRIVNYHYINRFSGCWVPDYASEINLAGSLSHPLLMPAVPVHYIGCLSRMEPGEPEKENSTDILIILSGPEPQRTILEKKILTEAGSIKEKIVLVRGLPGSSNDLITPSHITVFNHLPANKLARYLCSASYVISRSGYTSIMDYIKLGVRSILIPTPGQEEQEYLAGHLHQQQLAMAVEQNDFSLKEAIAKAVNFPYKKVSFNMEEYKSIITRYTTSIPG